MKKIMSLSGRPMRKLLPVWRIAVLVTTLAAALTADVSRAASPPPPSGPSPVPGRTSTATLNQFNATRGRNNISIDDKMRAQTKKKKEPVTTYSKRPASGVSGLHFSSYDEFGGGTGTVQQKRP